ncbi:Alanyl-tRNA_synthetase [Hexamita inflata]|uniref:Alanine--tRNA ligase n=1 Tax=Hexamita inflata TaxID=28002 RepID=A0AA86R129_9EUKA|nr:Alanyl-tRNA synthetase [Hexamita inflata]
MSMTAKEMKRMWRPRFAENATEYYPTEVFKKFGYSMATCPKCKTLYWRRTDKSVTCGDSECLGQYTFIGEQRGKVTPTCEAVLESFKDHFSQTSVPHKLVNRYPVVARWRDDCEFTAAGIQCYQPFCVTGEVDPPENPLIQPQFCLRFNDLDSIGISGRHYSGFHMLGIQVFNKTNDHKYWKEGIIEYNLQWLEKLGIDLDEVTLTADCWAGGGNLGPCVEYFINGLEVGNMVFMEFKCFGDGTLEKLPVQVIDVGIGLERIPWLLSGNVTSYLTAFPAAINEFCRICNVSKDEFTNDSWKKFGKYSCLLNVDEVEDINVTWKEIAEHCGQEVSKFKGEITFVRDVYILLDHFRSLLVAIQDGALPGNVGGGCNLRNILRRCFTLIEKRGWKELLDVQNIITIFDAHRLDLQKLHGSNTFQPFKALSEVISLELQRWKQTDEQSKAKVQKLMKKSGSLTIQDWVTIVTTFGMDPDSVSKITGLEVPGDLYCKIAEFQERNQVKTAAVQHYQLNAEQSTEQIYYSRPNSEQLFKFDEPNKIQKILNDVEDANKKQIIILEKTIFYPVSGGQQNDTGKITVDGDVYNVVNVTKVGPCVLHYVDREITFTEGEHKIELVVNAERRMQLMAHHTGAHVLSAACRHVLGPHVQQAGAKKQVEYATLDITHYQGISYEQQREIQNQCNRLIRQNIAITKQVLNKNEAEKLYGFTLYQGGVVPGSTVRCVSILDTDNEACCGTHLDSTAQVGLLKIQRTNRISDGVVRLQFVAGEAALLYDDEECGVVENLKKSWGVELQQIQQTADKFFEGYKSGEKLVNQLQKEILQVRIATRTQGVLNKYQVTESAPTRYLTEVGEVLGQLNQPLNAELLFVGDTFVVYVALKDKCTQLKTKLEGQGLKVKQNPLKMPKGKTTDAEMVLATGLEQKVVDDLMKM